MTEAQDTALRAHLLRPDGQEDICLATYLPSTGRRRITALIRTVELPGLGEREVHGNATITGEYVLRVAALAAQRGEGVVLLHSHPCGRRWQLMSGPDRDTESSYANLVREITGLPLVGMTLAGGDKTWSARHWDRGTASEITNTDCRNVRVVGGQLRVSWNDERAPAPRADTAIVRTVSSWGPQVHADLTRRSVLVVGLGSVGLDVAARLAATGITRLGLMDFDTVKTHNLDRLIGVTALDAALRRSKLDVAKRIVRANATATDSDIRTHLLSICEPDGLLAALDYDLIVCCVDRPWPRAVLNQLAYRDYIPVIDGGIAIDTFTDDTGMRNATWRAHILRPGAPCMSCIGQLDLAAVTADRRGDLDDPAYIHGAVGAADPTAANVAVLSISATALILALFVSLNVAPGGLGDPGPLQYLLSTHTLEHLHTTPRPHCVVEASTGLGDKGLRMTAPHPAADQERSHQQRRGTPWLINSLDLLLDRARRTLTKTASHQGGTPRQKES